MAGLFPLSRYQQFDENGQLLVGARLFLFDGGTTTPRAGYRDSSLSTLHPNPIVADAAGRLPLIYLANGFYRQRLTTASGVLVFDDDGIPVVSASGGGAGTSVDPLSTFKTRDIKIRFDNQQIDGYVRLNGFTIGTAASGASERANGTPGASDVQALYEELWPFSNIVVVGGKGANAPADFAANKPLVLPDCAGRGLFGVDNMGAGARGILTSATITNPTLPGSAGGNQQMTIAKANLPLYDLTGTMASFTPAGTVGSTSPSHTHTQQGTFTQAIGGHTHAYAAGANVVFGTGHAGLAGGAIEAVTGFTVQQTDTGTAGAHTNSITISGETLSTAPAHTHTFTGTATTGGTVTVSSAGSGTAFNNMPPVMTFMIYVRL